MVAPRSQFPWKKAPPRSLSACPSIIKNKTMHTGRAFLTGHLHSSSHQKHFIREAQASRRPENARTCAWNMTTCTEVRHKQMSSPDTLAQARAPEHDAKGVAVGRRGALAAVDQLGRRPLKRALEAAHLRAVAGQDARQAHVLRTPGQLSRLAG